MQTEPGTDNAKATLKFKITVINTVELQKVLEDEDFDGITLQLSHEIATASPGNSSQDTHSYRFIPYKHFSSKKKQEKITDPNFFANNNGNEISKDIGIGDEGLMSHFGNLKVTRAEMKEGVDATKFPFFVLSPERGSGEHENYIVCKAFYTDDLNNLSPHTQSLSRGVPIKSIGINPSPPA
ncbi:MAG: hypothetical protein ABI419_01280 [Ginsengibacter sp.]